MPLSDQRDASHKCNAVLSKSLKVDQGNKWILSIEIELVSLQTDMKSELDLNIVYTIFNNNFICVHTSDRAKTKVSAITNTKEAA